MNLHRLAEERSLAYHQEVAKRLLADPALVETARRRVAEWTERHRCHPQYLAQWTALLERPLAEIVRALVEPSEPARALRQSTPFAGMLDSRERWRIWRTTRARLEGEL